MKVTLELPQVSRCDVDGCVYNKEKSCHARAITIGDGRRPGCDTFFTSSEHARDTKTIAGVGACKVSSCQYNKDFECSASEIKVGYSKDKDILCLTFNPR